MSKPSKPRLVACLLVAAGLVAGAAALLVRPSTPDPERTPPAVAAAVPSIPEPGIAEPAPAPEPPAPAKYDNLMYRPVPPEVKERLLGMEAIQQRLLEIERQNQATLRFRQAVDEGGFEADQVNRSVVDLFQTMELEPILDEESMILGLQIRTLVDESPLRRAGFREGDVITSINDTRLHDPADLPDLMVRLERDLGVCVERDSREICRRIVLD